MVGMGATRLGFIDRSFTQQHNLELERLDHYIDLYGFDRAQICPERISHTVAVRLEHDNHTECISLFVTTLGKHSVILGMPWMKKHEIVLD